MDRELPSNEMQYQALRAKGLVHRTCIICSNEFSKDNVFTSQGWKETQTVRVCEKCIDSTFSKFQNL